MLTNVIVAFSITLLVVAAPGHHPGTIGQCNTGSIQCCNTLQSADHPSLAGLLGVIGIVAEVGAQVGLGCDPISVIGLGQGANCAQQPVCCQNNEFSGLVSNFLSARIPGVLTLNRLTSDALPFPCRWVENW
ncbi:fungal hydrophobin-domain-containing protein [Hysterangium stoloniferum]|nr:fungal hydrophobin-domain-containing protein [Hysterangium stoloniferum]